MENLKASELVDGYYQFGNKGAVWGNETHMAESGKSTTLCTPMLSFNRAGINKHPEIGCQKCLSKYSDLNVIPRVKEPKYKFTRPALWFCKNDIVEVDKIKEYYTEKCIEELVKYGYLELINE